MLVRAERQRPLQYRDRFAKIAFEQIQKTETGIDVNLAHRMIRFIGDLHAFGAARDAFHKGSGHRQGLQKMAAKDHRENRRGAELLVFAARPRRFACRCAKSPRRGHTGQPCCRQRRCSNASLRAARHPDWLSAAQGRAGRPRWPVRDRPPGRNNYFESLTRAPNGRVAEALGERFRLRQLLADTRPDRRAEITHCGSRGADRFVAPTLPATRANG